LAIYRIIQQTTCNPPVGLEAFILDIAIGTEDVIRTASLIFCAYYIPKI
jgi:hypothetical protein